MTFSRRWITLFALGMIFFALSGWKPVFLGVGLLWHIALIALLVADWRRLPARGLLTVEREMEDRLAQNSDHAVRLRVRNGSSHTVRLDVKDTPPPALPNDLNDAPLAFTLKPQSRQTSAYRLQPQQRGDFRFGDLWLRVHGRLGLVQRQWRVSASETIKVYPNLSETARFTLMARKGRLQQAGIRQARLQGAGREFESLRDYLPDDEMRRIDWKASARRGKLVARQYEVERSQSVLIALDIGRTMLAEIDGVPKLDYAINAALLLAHVATLSDDRVGLLVFSDTVHQYLPPQRGRQQVYAMLDALYNVKATFAEPDYRTAFAYAQARHRRRSLVVCFTDLWDPDSSRQAIRELAGLQPRHLPVAVTLLDTNVLRVADQPLTTPLSVYEKAVATQVMDDRERTQRALTQRNVLVVDSPADRLSVELVNRYIEVKERMLL